MYIFSVHTNIIFLNTHRNIKTKTKKIYRFFNSTQNPGNW